MSRVVVIITLEGDPNDRLARAHRAVDAISTRTANVGSFTVEIARTIDPVLAGREPHDRTAAGIVCSTCAAPWSDGHQCSTSTVISRDGM